MTTVPLRILLKSAATFGRGDGVAGLIDREIEYDAQGLPAIRGRTLKGLLREAAENVVYALEELGQFEWQEVRDTLFGKPGRGEAAHDQGILHVGDAGLPGTLRQLLAYHLHDRHAAEQKAYFSPASVLASLTAIRRQTAMNPQGGPEQGSLRAMRVLIRGVTLEAELSTPCDFSEAQQGLLAATVLEWRRGGTGRNRGRGHVLAELADAETTQRWFNHLKVKVENGWV